MLAMVFGLLALVPAGVAIARVSQALGALGAIPVVTISPGYGIFLCIVGGLLLMIGGFLAMGDAKKAAMMPPPMSAMPPPPA
jgi:uncharacterized membrane protein YidH (DUF202 family)